MKILVTGFDPFGGEAVNPAWEAVSRLPERIGGAEVVRMQLPTVFGRAPELALEEARRIEADWIVAVGQAAGRNAITPERIAINYQEASIPDNAGAQPSGGPVISGGPDGYFSLLPVKEMAAAIQAAGLPGKVSNTAGTYVCNHLMYHILHACHTGMPGVRGGFIHVPCIPQQRAGHPEWFAMELDEIVRGLAAALAVLTR